jgi:formylmethanofuran dehydrogenase subunit E
MVTIDQQLVLSPEAYREGLQKAEAFHGHLCPGMYTGVKMALLARQLLGYPAFPDRDLIVIAEIDRCLTDAVMSFTGCRLGRRTMKFRDEGKFAATFCSLAQGQGIRIAQNSEAFGELETLMKSRGVDSHDKEQAAEVYFEYPWQRHFTLNILDVSWNENDLPGFPKVKEVCSRCHETIMDNRHLTGNDGTIVCKACEAYKHGEKGLS